MKFSRYRLVAVVAGLSLAAAAIASKPQAQAGAAAQVADDAPTPRMPDGHPDLSGLWRGGRGGGAGGPAGTPANAGRDALGAALGAKGIPALIIGAREDEYAKGYENLERDAALRLRLRANKPLYKPQYWETVRKFDENSNEDDPGFHCMPAGVPRTGAPAKIVQTPTELIFLHPGQGGAIAVVDTYRVIPIDGREHSPIEELDGSLNGEPVGRWQGDTMVIDTIGFNSASWLAQGGYFHTANMHVVERLTRKGNTLTWQATVEDPEVLAKPWVMDMVTARLNPNPKARLPETPACSERDYPNLFTKEHH